MKSPFATPTTIVNPCTGPQRDFLLALAEQKAQLSGKEFDRDKSNDFIDRLSRRDASEHIDRLKYEIAVLKREAYQSDTVLNSGLEGFWELPDGRIVKVQVAVHNSGNLYGKVLDTDTGRFEYVQGILSEVRKNGTRLPLDRAKELGKLYGRCISCGRTLTDEYSIENGIGPICAQKF